MALPRIRRAAFAVAASSLVVAAATAPAFADDSYTVPLHQPVPITADSFGKPEPKCADIPATQDGWHFIAPGSPNEVSFVKLTVRFEPGGEQVITAFGPPNDNHAYAASEPGAKLVSAVAQVEGTTGGGKKLEWFNLSHTCPATATPTPTRTTTASPSASVSASVSASTSASASASTSASASASASTSAPASSSVSPSASASSPAPSGPAAGTGGSTGGGDLAKTGSDAPVGLIATMAAALIAAGALLVVRRRKSGTAG
ncbi:LPXTG cell wall anchor domain-containing protein [Streptomyces xanthophaeus]|uniref:LPXTG cell wall anchor domain-containing protein n=1 Tax=Streptomyces xanthophaeus TaxID=67385 RepID=UPI0038631DD2|nr:LPXTG cell wall anchor domain-containing protein [Streptomyces xanthophaeus]WST62087.1 LPXTG cell wall anchor domain-containing protein [Streptomyces xanthophaeus]